MLLLQLAGRCCMCGNPRRHSSKAVCYATASKPALSGAAAAAAAYLGLQGSHRICLIQCRHSSGTICSGLQ